MAATEDSQNGLRFKIDPQTGCPEGSHLVVCLNQGQSFGEQGLLYDHKRSATVVTQQHCQFAVLERLAFDDVLREHFLRIARRKIRFLEGAIAEAFGSYEYIEGFFKETTIQCGQVICEAGKSNAALEVIYEGTCKILHHPEHESERERHGFVLGEMTPGQFLGVSSLLLGKPEPYD